jgi:hypothetical protein
MCFVWISEQTAITFLYSINRLVFVTETESVYCAVRISSSYIKQIRFVFKGLITDSCPSLFTVFCCHLFTFVSQISFSSSSNHLGLGILILLLPYGLLSNIFLTVPPWSILTIMSYEFQCYLVNICYNIQIFIVATVPG